MCVVTGALGVSSFVAGHRATTPFGGTTSIDRIRKLRVYGDDEFPADDPTNRDYWTGVVAAAGAPILVAGVLFPLFYWWFLCCRNGCCKCCKCFGCFKCCCADEGEGCRKTLPCIQGRPLTARFCLLIGFAIIIGLHGGLVYAFNSMSDASDKVGDQLDYVGDIFEDLVVYMEDWEDSAQDIVRATKNLNCSADYADELAEEVRDFSREMKDQSTEVIDLISDLPEKCYDLADKTTQGKFMMYAVGVLAIGFVFAGIGLLGTICFESSNKRCCKFASTLLLLGNCLAVPLMFLVACMLSLELFIGYPLADFCAAGPAATLGTLAINQLDDGTEFTDVITFYTSCEGENPMQEYYDTGVAAATNVSDLLDDYEDVFISDTLCCESSWVVSVGGDIEDADPDELEENCIFYTGSNGCTTDSYCDYDNVTNGGLCSAGASCSNSSYATMADQIDYILLDEEGPLNKFYESFHCSVINPILMTLLGDALCTDTMDGLYYLISTHALVLALMMTTLIFSSFVRQAILTPSGDDAKKTLYGDDFKVELPSAHYVTQK